MKNQTKRYCLGCMTILVNKTYKGVVKNLLRSLKLASYFRVFVHNSIKSKNEKVILKLGEEIILIYPY